MKKAVGYTRSTVQGSVSLSEQEAALRAFCARENIKIAGVYADTAPGLGPANAPENDDPSRDPKKE